MKNRDIKRFVLSAFYHMGESHLVYNMMSLLWKGVQLELAMGSTDFAVMIASLLGMSQGITLLLAKLLDVFFDYETSYYNEYAVGFSGVLFAMKVVLNARSEDFAYVHGLVVPARHAAWVELVLIQLFVPGVSFLGHLGGILAGILYLRLRGSGTRRDPMSIMLRRVIDILGWPVKHVRDYFRRRQGQTFGRGRVGGGEQGSGSRTGQVWRCSVCTFDNSSVLNRCAMCDMLRDGGQVSTGQGPVRRNREPSLEELRQRRLERFGR
ncbi:rhomboid-like protein 14, mitochondrial isoform X2 [Amborella trichopoda]|uniref:rhomboid-like protein 14, mitochondrial isoform X2 n=1 Tax=Amborella trichopoda TaxID=13333 RepID=UPI0009C067DB|nr:rhomboid-like protein 14, mitochondrial isoform X2 [Amborella trichopoda]|eukprot:XP_020520398.1 rhomboid-like protein 14, mitochondrial isoform X2 [Amborella trichopoda]